MSRFSQKPIDDKMTTSRVVDNAVLSKTGSYIVRSSKTGRFKGMFQNTEKMAAVVIPGYKIRG